MKHKNSGCTGLMEALYLSHVIAEHLIP